MSSCTSNFDMEDKVGLELVDDDLTPEEKQVADEAREARFILHTPDLISDMKMVHRSPVWWLRCSLR